MNESCASCVTNIPFKSDESLFTEVTSLSQPRILPGSEIIFPSMVNL